jgi:hypothetical protein
VPEYGRYQLAFMYSEAASRVTPAASFLMGFCHGGEVREPDAPLVTRPLPKHGLQASKA